MNHIMKFEQFSSNLDKDYLRNESLSSNLKNAFVGLLMLIGTSVSGQTIDDLMANPDFNAKYHTVERLVCEEGYSEEDAKQVINWFVAKKLDPLGREMRRPTLSASAKDLLNKTQEWTAQRWMSPESEIEDLYGPTIEVPDYRRHQ